MSDAACIRRSRVISVRLRSRTVGPLSAALNICPNGNENNIGLTRLRPAAGRRGHRRCPACHACTPDGPGPAAAEKFFPRWPSATPRPPRSSATAPTRPARRSTRPGPACRRPTSTRRSSAPSTPRTAARVGYRFTWHLPKNRTWTYDGQLKMARDEGHWAVRWTTTGLHPKLGEHQTFALRADRAAPRLGERARRQRRAGAGLPVPLHAGRHPGRTGPDRRRRTRSSTRCTPSTTPSTTRSCSPSKPARRPSRWIW